MGSTGTLSEAYTSWLGRLRAGLVRFLHLWSTIIIALYLTLVLIVLTLANPRQSPYAGMRRVKGMGMGNTRVIYPSLTHFIFVPSRTPVHPA